jgi:hypothetical protein
MLFKIIVNFNSEKNRKSINTLFEIILMLNQVVRILATLLKMRDVKNTSHGSNSTIILLQLCPRNNFRHSKYKAWNSTNNILFTLTQNIYFWNKHINVWSIHRTTCESEANKIIFCAEFSLLEKKQQLVLTGQYYFQIFTINFN